MPMMEIYVSEDVPASQLVQRIRQTVVASPPHGERVRRWGGHTIGTRVGNTNMFRCCVEYESERSHDCER